MGETEFKIGRVLHICEYWQKQIRGIDEKFR